MVETQKRQRREPTSLDKERGVRIRNARTNKELTQVALADITGVSAGLVGQWETGVTGLTADNAAILERVLDVPMAWLLTGDDPHQKRLAQTSTEQAHLEVIRAIPIENQEDFLVAIQAIAKAFQKK